MELVTGPQDFTWNDRDHNPGPRSQFAFTAPVVDESYTTAWSAQRCKIRPGGESRPHRDTYNHAFFVTKGTGAARIGDRTWDVQPGSIVRIPIGELHGFKNTGHEDLEFLVIYDPPTTIGMQES